MNYFDNLARELIMLHPHIQERYDFTTEELIQLCEKYRSFQFTHIYIDPARSLLAVHIIDRDGDAGWLKVGYGLNEEELEIFDWC